MPMKVPSMPSSTSSPARSGAIAGPGRATRSPSMRERTTLRSAAGSVLQPAGQVGRRLAQGRQRALQCRAVAVEALQFQRAHQVERADQQRDAQGQRVLCR